MGKQTEMETKPYILEGTDRVYRLPKYACVFCKYCADVWYDSRGIHHIFCEKENHAADIGNYPVPICKEFQEEN